MRILFSTLGVAFLSTALHAQVAPNPYRTLPLNHDSGPVSNSDIVHRMVWRQTVRVPGATWLRLEFADGSRLDRDSFLRITSRHDGHVQLFESWSLAAYGGYSAGFNGATVDVELWAAPFSSRNRAIVAAVQAGDPQIASPASQCGPTDDRALSLDKRQARQFPTGCTTWLIGKFAGATAGHCTSNTAQQMHFNVPASTSNGTKVLPPPSDQYAYDRSSVRRLNGGVGRDWAVFATVRNSNTGLYPGEKQGAWYELGTPISSGTIRITGYGTDTTPRTRNQVQQTHTGPLSFYDSNRTRLCYVVDTTGGNSGSPVIDERSGKAIGIHTHGGCRTSGSGCNSGTSINRSDLQNAIRAVLASRVAGSIETLGQGCRGSNGTTTLRGTGTPDIGNRFTLSAAGMPRSGIALLTFGLSKTSWLSLRLPFALGTTAPGCSIYASIDASEGFATSSAGTWSRSYTVPNNRTFIGLAFYQQVVAIDAAANTAGLTTSNGIGIEVGGIR